MKKIALSFDVEPDLHTKDYKGITKGINKILSIISKYNLKATFFVTCDCIEKYPKIFQDLVEKGHEIALHGYRHRRFDEISYKEKEEQIKKSIKCFKKYLKQNPKGFRAPEHSIDKQVLHILKKYKFTYDSSYTPLNLLQLFFFPNKFGFYFKHFFSKKKPYKIIEDFYEIPVSAVFFPFVGLVFRIFPEALKKIYFNLLKIFNKDLIFYAHSWDFIDVSGSRIAKKWPKERLINKLDCFIEHSIKKNKFCKIIDLIKK